MLETPEAVLDALRENDDRPYGLHRTVTAEELAEAAEAFEDAGLLVTALLELMAAYEFTGEHRKSPVVFARLLKLHESTPDAFSEWAEHQIHWRFKWVTTSLLQVPDMPLTTVHGWIDRMRERYEDAGHGLQPVAAMRYHVARHTGDGVPGAYDLWATRTRTDLSDCEACETRHHALHQADAGDDTGALDTLRPVLDGAVGCSDEPQMSQAHALLPLLRLGRTDEARSHHLTGYRKIRGRTGMQEELGLHLEFCALSRNTARGVEILAENRPLFEATGAPLARLGFLTGTEVLLARLVEEGHARTPVGGPPGRNRTAGELLAEVREEADRLAAAFDTRNGTTAVGDARRLRVARRPCSTSRCRSACAPCSPAPPPSRPPPPPPPARCPRTSPHWSVRHAGWPPSAIPGTPALGPDRRGRGGRRVPPRRHARPRAAVARRTRRTARPHPPRRGPRPGGAHRDGGDRRAVRGRQDALARAGRPGPRPLLGRRHHRGRGRRGRPRRRPGRGRPPDSPELRAALDALLREAERLLEQRTAAHDATGDDPGPLPATGPAPGSATAEKYLTVLHCRVFAAYHALLASAPEIPAPVRERFEASRATLHTEAGRLGVAHQRGAARVFAGDVAARLGEHAVAEPELRAALEEIDGSGRPWRGTRVRALLAQVLLALGKPGEAASLLHRALAEAVRYEDALFPMAPTYLLLGHAGTHTGDLAGAVRHFSEAATRFDRAGEPDDAADARLQLADLLVRTGRQADAVAVLESVVGDESAAGLDRRLLAQARLTLGRGLRELGEHLPAAEEFLRLADTVASWEDAGATLTLVAAEAATALALAGRWEAARAAYARAFAAHAEAPDPPMLLETACEFARLTMAARGAEGTEEALRHLADADTLRTAVPEDDEDFVHWFAAGSVHYRRARVLAEAERFAEALPEAEQAVAAFDSGGADGEERRAEAVRIAALVEGRGLGRTQAAVTRLTEAAARCERARLHEAAQILTAVRDDLAAGDTLRRPVQPTNNVGPTDR
ncbi:tetratricopeptide repeat protein [Streptomyces sp. S399]|uniref:tetratricopeptide repeat protein n=1 Tax=Streptomyces sp. S399 TaxID=3096009 RepID=UPI002A7F6A50|nr:tetratricopeptide repeat protein [Streptomyces sp. S399]WPR54290.1 tetratricopeptide repeat protein [Streptomyces sp. S399]